MPADVAKPNRNRRNYLLKVQAVHEVYLREKIHEGITNEWIFNTHIYPVFFISKATFYHYLNVNVKQELRQILELEKETIQCEQ